MRYSPCRTKLRYFGPEVVFEPDWDATGAIQLTLGHYSLVSEVVSPNLILEKGAAEITMYGDAVVTPHSNQLFIYNVHQRTSELS